MAHSGIIEACWIRYQKLKLSLSQSLEIFDVIPWKLTASTCVVKKLFLNHSTDPQSEINQPWSKYAAVQTKGLHLWVSVNHVLLEDPQLLCLTNSWLDRFGDSSAAHLVNRVSVLISGDFFLGGEGGLNNKNCRRKILVFISF